MKKRPLVMTEAAPPKPRTMIGMQELANRWDCSTRHLRRLMDAKKIPRPIRLGALIRWHIAAIEQFERDGFSDRYRGTGGR